MEEAGAVLEGDLRYFAAHVADSNRDKPFRPHLPHPRTYWAYATAQVRLVCEPINPEDGETVVEVVTLCPTAAADYIEDHDQVHADVLRHAVALGLLPLRPDEVPVRSTKGVREAPVRLNVGALVSPRASSHERAPRLPAARSYGIDRF
jgi:hypothetical protein